MRQLATAVLLFFSITALAAAQSFLVISVQGHLDLQEKEGWFNLATGDSVPADGVIRLGPKSYARLSDGAASIGISEAGEYHMPDLVLENRVVSSAGLDSLLTQRLGALSVRSDNRDDLIGRGLHQLQQGKFGEAFASFKDAYQNGHADASAEASFYMGFTAALRHDVFNAIEYLTAYESGPSSKYHTDQILTLAQLYVQTFAYGNAVKLLGPYIDANKGSAPTIHLQTAYLLDGLAYQGLGDKTKASAALQQARDLIPGSDLSASAAKLLAEM